MSHYWGGAPLQQTKLLTFVEPPYRQGTVESACHSLLSDNNQAALNTPHRIGSSSIKAPDNEHTNGSGYVGDKGSMLL